MYEYKEVQKKANALKSMMEKTPSILQPQPELVSDDDDSLQADRFRTNTSGESDNNSEYEDNIRENELNSKDVVIKKLEREMATEQQINSYKNATTIRTIQVGVAMAKLLGYYEIYFIKTTVPLGYVAIATIGDKIVAEGTNCDYAVNLKSKCFKNKVAGIKKTEQIWHIVKYNK